MNDIIEGTAVAVHTEKQAPKLRYQATIKARTDHKLSQVENHFVEVAAPKDAITDLLVAYLCKRVNRLEVRNVLEAYVRGCKPKIKRASATKYEVVFHDDKDQFIEQYDITFIEL
jgi:hypothetical protein